MAKIVVLLRIISLLAFAWPMLLRVSRRADEVEKGAHEDRLGRAPVVANFSAFGLFFCSLLILPGSSATFAALPLALMGCLLALAGAGIVLRSRVALGSAWSFVPKADAGIGLMTSGPYRLVRHPIYLGLAVLALGQALAFASWPACLVVLFGIGPTFFWRAHAEETLLIRVFGREYELYRQRTRMIIPHLL